jgi:phosphoglycerate-specific signal transduction histidine kinase
VNVSTNPMDDHPSLSVLPNISLIDVTTISKKMFLLGIHRFHVRKRTVQKFSIWVWHVCSSIPQSLYQQHQNHLADVIYEAATVSNHFGYFHQKCLAQ